MTGGNFSTPAIPGRVSVVMPSLNQAAFIRQAVDSVLSQSHRDVELIIADGLSTDGTLDILRSYGDRVRLTAEKDKNLAEAINKGLRKATGEFVFTLASDEVLYPGALAALVDAMKRTGADIVVGEGAIIDEEGREIAPIENGEGLTWEEVITLERKMPLACSFFRRSVFEKRLLDEEFVVCTDFMFWLNIFHDVRIVFEHIKVAQWRRHGESWSVNPKAIRTLYNARYLAFGKFFSSHPEWTRLRGKAEVGAARDLVLTSFEAGEDWMAFTGAVKIFISHPILTSRLRNGEIVRNAVKSALRLVRLYPCVAAPEGRK